MTAGRFCAQCGREAGGGAFCQHCGAAQAAAPPAPGNTFCANCGTRAEPGLAFCTNCGANLSTGVPLARSQYAQPSAVAPSKTPLYLGVGAVVIALVVAVVIMSNGGSNDSGNSSGGASSATTGTSSGGNNKPERKDAPVVATPPKPVQVSLPNTPSALLGEVDEGAATAISNALTKTGLNLKGVDVIVFRVTNSEERMLVFDVDTAQATGFSNALSNDAKLRKLAQAVVSGPVLKGANITRLTMNLRGRDTKGAYVMGVTMSTMALEGIANGTIRDADLQKQMQMKVSRS